MALLPVSFSIDESNHLVATITGTGDGGVENGLALLSQPFTIQDVGDVDLGSATQGVSSFKFVLNGDSNAAVVAIGPDHGFTVIGADGQTGMAGTPPSPDLLQRFWGGITSDLTASALSGAFEEWIVTNAVGAPLLVVIGIVSGGGAFVLAAVAKGADLVAIFFTKVAEEEVSEGTISSAEADLIKAWAKVGDTALQLPSILTDESTLVKVTGLIAADVNFASESVNAKLGVTYAADGVAKYVLALSALMK